MKQLLLILLLASTNFCLHAMEEDAEQFNTISLKNDSTTITVQKNKENSSVTKEVHQSNLCNKKLVLGIGVTIILVELALVSGGIGYVFGYQEGLDSCSMTI